MLRDRVRAQGSRGPGNIGAFGAVPGDMTVPAVSHSEIPSVNGMRVVIIWTVD